MKRRRLLPVMLLLAFVATAVYVSWRRAHAYDLVLGEKPDTLAQAWPLRTYWNWTAQFPPLAKNQRVQLRVHCKSTPLPKPGEPLPLSSTGTSVIPFREADGTARAADGFDANSKFGDGPLVVSFQILESPFDHPPATQPETDLRMLGSVRQGGATSNLTDTERLPQHGSVSGWSIQSNTNWVGDTLLLGRFWISDADRQTRCDVFLYRHDPSQPDS